MGLLPHQHIARDLGRILGCEVRDDPAALGFYSLDASPYRVAPRAVVFPEGEDDVAAAVSFAAGRGVPVTPRGAGTGLAGGALGSHIVMDMGRMGGVGGGGGGSVTAGAGAPKGALDAWLARRGEFLSPDPSVGGYCTLGGMVGTNASGIHALKYGSVVDNLLQVTLIDGRGERVTLPDDAGAGGRILGIARRADLSRFPRTAKNSCGYRLDAVRAPADAHRVVAGSEGTLGVVTSARFRVWRAPRGRSLSVITYAGPGDVHRDVHRDVGEILKLGPSAVEYLDRTTMRNAGLCPPSGGRAGAALFVEFDGEPPAGGGRIRRMDGATRGRREFSVDSPREILEWWGRRNSALSCSMRDAAGGAAAAHAVEDAAVPVGRLAGAFRLIDGIRRRCGARAVVYGHAGSGNLHVRLAAGRGSPGRGPPGAAREFFRGILLLGGTITAEHGDGLARSGFVRMQYGELNYRLFGELKKTMDPHGIMNPGKVVARGGPA